MMTSPFRPPRWFKSPHLQTIGAAAPLFSPPRSHVVADQELLRIPIPGEEGHLHARAWWLPRRAPAVVLVHGIAGHKDSPCCVRAAVAFHRAGYHTARLDMRGAGDSVVDAPSLYHAGLSQDLDVVVRRLVDDPRVSGVLVVGFSGGGGQALKLAGEWGADAPEGVLGVATISAPLDYTRVVPHMDRLAAFPYRFHVLRGLLDRARAFARLRPHRAHYAASDLGAIKRFRHFDAQVMVPMHGFRDVDDYYWAASAGPYLAKIEVPTLILHAEDDPMVPVDTLQPWLSRASRAVRVRKSPHGGHIGWLSGFDESSWIKGWATSETLAFFAEHVPAPTLRAPAPAVA